MTGDRMVVLSGKSAALSMAITINWAVCLLLFGMCWNRDAGISMVATTSCNDKQKLLVRQQTINI